MGDRCWMRLICLKKDQEAFEDMGFGEDDFLGEDGPAVSMVDEEAPCCHNDALEAMAGKGVPFIAEHCAGGNYGPGEFACDGNEVIHDETNHYGDLYARIDPETGEVLQADVDHARKFMEMKSRAKKLLEG